MATANGGLGKLEKAVRVVLHDALFNVGACIGLDGLKWRVALCIAGDGEPPPGSGNGARALYDLAGVSTAGCFEIEIFDMSSLVRGM